MQKHKENISYIFIFTKAKKLNNKKKKIGGKQMKQQTVVAVERERERESRTLPKQ